MAYDDEDSTVPDLSNRQILAVLMQEIADVRLELKGDIAGLKMELKGDIANLDKKLSGRIDGLASEVHTLRIEVHQNQSTFIKNHDALERRVTTLEVAA